MLAGPSRYVPIAVVLLAMAGSAARASTGVCDSNGATSTQACLDAVNVAGGIVNDSFHDAYGRTADQLPSHGTLYNAWPGCDTTDFGGCAGQSVSPYDCPGEYTCRSGVANTFANAGASANALDHLWWASCRIANHTLVGGCPQFGPAACVPGGTPGNYNPWEGLVFDLGAVSNRVALFAANLHGPQPCESLNYTVYLTDDPSSRDLISDPVSDGVDPTKWNRAVLKTVFTAGDVSLRSPDPFGHSACGDTNSYAVEMDSMVPVFALPAATNLRYAAVIAGNDGLDYPQCAYDSALGEIDAVAGLSEVGAGVCPGGLSSVEGATGLTWASDGHTLSWSSLNGATTFDVYRGTITSPWTYEQSCLDTGVAATSVSDPALPSPAGRAFFYFVAGRDNCGDSLLGRRSDGTAVPPFGMCP